MSFKLWARASFQGLCKLSASAGVAVPGEHKAEPSVELTVEPMVEPRRVPRGLIWGVWW